MPIAATLVKLLDANRIVHDVIELKPFTSPREAAVAAGIASASLMKVVVVHDGAGLVAATMPANHELDLRAFSELLNRPVDPASELQLQKVFHDCSTKYLPAPCMAYGVGTVVHASFVALDKVYFLGGDRRTVIRVERRNFHRLFRKQDGVIVADGYSAPVMARPVPTTARIATRSSPDVGGAVATPLNIKERIRSLGKLPAMPEMGRRILQLRATHEPDIGKLAELVELDPSLAAQVMRYARSPFFGYRGVVDSVRVAMSRVLGYDMVMNLALGLATARPFRIPKNGPLGLDAFWRHAVYSAALTQALSGLVPPGIRPPSGMAYLAGLSHNFGHLLIGHLFRDEFTRLNGLVEQHPERTVTSIELTTIGADHAEVGSMLMEYWKLPEEVVVAIREHHNENYHGPHAVYPQLVLIVDRMLKRHGLGDASGTQLPPEILGFLEISEYQIDAATKRILEGREGLETMAQQLAA